MMKKIYLFCFALMLSNTAYSQQELLHTQFMFNKLAYNPGYAGSFISPTLSVLYRNQWMGLDGAPKMQGINYSQAFWKHRFGFGANIVNTTQAITKTFTVDVNPSYRIAMRGGAVMSFGFKIGYRQYNQDWTDKRLAGTLPISTDQAIPTEAQGKGAVNIGAGFYFQSNSWYMGFAVPRLIENNIDFADYGSVFSREKRHYNAMGGITLNNKSKFTVTPQVLIKYAAFAPFDADLNVNLEYDHQILAGMTYRTGGDVGGAGESIDVLLGLQATSNLFIALSYDIGLTSLRKYNNGSLELTARWWFNPPEGSEIIDISKPF